MVPNSQLKPALLMTMLMLLSIALAPVSDWSRVTGDERTDETSIDDHSHMQQEGLELSDDFSLKSLAPGECMDNLVVQVTYPNHPGEHRYSNADLKQLIDNEVASYLKVATYDSVCMDTTVVSYTTKFDSDALLEDGSGTYSNSHKLRAEIRTDPNPNIGQAAEDADIVSMITNEDGHYGKGGSWKVRVPSYGAIKWNPPSDKDDNGFNINQNKVFLCKDSGNEGVGLVSDLNGVAANTVDGGPLVAAAPNQKTCDYGRNDFLSLYAHELLHAIGVGGHAASNYRMCHDIMGSACSATVQPSSWLRVDMGWYPSEYVTVLQPSPQTQQIKLRPLNLNLLDDISGSPTTEQIQIIKIPLSSEKDALGNPDPKIYYLLEARPRITLDDSGGTILDISDADNLPHCYFCKSANHQPGLPSEGVVIYTVNEWLWNNPNDGGTLEPLRVVDAVDSTSYLDDAAFGVGTSYDNGYVDGNGDGKLDCYYCVSVSITSTVNSNYFLNIDFQTPDMGLGSGPGDMYISPTPVYDGVTPTISIDIWVDSMTNNYDVIEGDFGSTDDGDVTTNIDAVYMWHKDGDVRSPTEGSGDPPAFENWNWVYARVKNIGDGAIDANVLQVGMFWRKPASSESPESAYSYIHGGHWQDKGPLVFCPPKSTYANGLFCGKIDPGAEPHITYGPAKGGFITVSEKLPQPILMNPSLSTNPNILYPGEEYIIGTAWYPRQSDYDWLDTSDGGDQYQRAHACIDVRIYPTPDEPTAAGAGDIDVDKIITTENLKKFFPNNWAYENIGLFEVSKGSPYETITGEFDVMNTRWHDGTAGLEIEDMPSEFTFNYWPSTIDVESNGTATFEYSISVEDSWEMGSSDSFRIYSYVEVEIDGDIHRYRQEGGLTLGLQSVELVEIDVDVNFDGGAIIVDGTMVSQGYTVAGENYAGSVVALEYYTPEGVSILRPALLTPGSGTALARFDPGSSIDISYEDPLGRVHTSSRTMDANGEYMDSFSLDEQGDWTIIYTYTSRDGSTHEWREVVNVPGRPISAPIAEGYEKTSGIGLFQDVFTGTADVPLNDGNWNVRVLFAGDSIHRSTMTTNQTVRVEGMPIVHPAIDIDDVFVLEGTLATGVHSDSELVVNYVSPSGIDYRHTLSVDRYNDYYDRIILDEAGVWKIELRYMDVNRESIEWTETVSVIMNEVGPITHEPVIDQITHEDTISGGDVTVGGRLNSTTVTAGTVVTIRAWSPSGVFTTRDVTTDEDMRFENDIKMDESGRWTIEYEYTDDDGNVMSWGEAIDVEDTAEEPLVTYNNGVLIAMAILALIGLALVSKVRLDSDQYFKSGVERQKSEESLDLDKPDIDIDIDDV